MTIANFNPDTSTCTGGFTTAVMSSINVIDPNVRGEDRSGQFLAGPFAGYCIDAPDYIPAGCIWESRWSHEPVQRFVIR